MKRLVLGIDFGSLSARAVVVDTDTGKILGGSVSAYEHGVIQNRLPNGTSIPETFTLQLPADYINSMIESIHGAVKDAGVSGDSICGIGLCTTASTVLPIDKNGTPLCELKEYENEPHAYMKMWKHRGAVLIAERMNRIAEEMKEPWYLMYGNVITCEWLPPKAIEIAEDAPQIYDCMDAFIEVGDWIVQFLCGNRVRSRSLAASNSLIRENEMPSEAYYGTVCSKARTLYRDKLAAQYCDTGTAAGYLTPKAAEMLGLRAGIPVAPAAGDAQATVAASGGCRPGDMTLIVGTSAVEILLEDKCPPIKGIHISAKNAAIPGLYSIGGGQSCVGDGFGWFVDQCVSATYQHKAEEYRETVHEYLIRIASSLNPGAGGVMAMDWWNGQRSPNFDFSLSGCLIGMTLSTKPEQIYRAMLEGSAFGARRVLDLLRNAGCTVNRVFAGGGIPKKNPLLMQIYSDVLNLPVSVCECAQTGALGSAMMGAMAMGIAPGNVSENMASDAIVIYKPQTTVVSVYDKIYREYLRTAAFFEDNDSPLHVIHSLR